MNIRLLPEGHEMLENQKNLLTAFGAMKTMLGPVTTNTIEKELLSYFENYENNQEKLRCNAWKALYSLLSTLHHSLQVLLLNSDSRKELDDKAKLFKDSLIDLENFHGPSDDAYLNATKRLLLTLGNNDYDEEIRQKARNVMHDVDTFRSQYCLTNPKLLEKYDSSFVSLIITVNDAIKDTGNDKHLNDLADLSKQMPREEMDGNAIGVAIVGSLAIFAGLIAIGLGIAGCVMSFGLSLPLSIGLIAAGTLMTASGIALIAKRDSISSRQDSLTKWCRDDKNRDARNIVNANRLFSASIKNSSAPLAMERMSMAKV